MKKRVKWLIGALIVIGIIASVIYSKNKAFQTELFQVEKVNVSATVTEKGKLVTSDSLDIFSEIQGKAIEVNPEVGDAVKRGDVLVKINTDEIESQIAQLQGELKAMQGTESATQIQINYNLVKQQEAAVEQAKIALSYAEDTLKRLQNLFKEGAVTTTEVDQAQNDVDTKQKLLAQNQAALAQTKSDIALQGKQKQGNKLQYQGQRESLLAKIAYLKEQRGKGVIAAPLDGRILSKKIKSGDYLTPGAPLFTLGNVENLIIETFVNSKDLLNINVQDKVNVIFKSAEKDIEIQGVITKISPVAEERVSALGIVEDKIKVEIELTAKPAKINLIPGISADVVLTTQKADNVLAVPKDVIFTDNAKDFVWIVWEGRAKLAEVQKGIEGDELVEIKGGINPNELIIINPHQKELKEGLIITGL